MNAVTLTGNLGHDPEIFYAKNGTAITRFTVYVHDQYKDKSGKTQKISHRVTVKAFRRLAEVAAEHLKSGHKVGVTGRLVEEKWEKEGEKPDSALRVYASRLEFLSGSEAQKAAAGVAGSPESAASSVQPPAAIDEITDLEPF
jgi:single-strand DNA-binding protein